MAGFDLMRGLGAAGSLGTGYFEGQDELLRRRMLENQLQQQLQQQQGLAALANAYGQLQQPPVAPAPNPGQPSMPAQPPQGGMQMQPPPTGGAGGPPGIPPQGVPPPRMGPQFGPVGMPQPQGMQPPPAQMPPQASPPMRPYTAPQAPQVPGPQAGAGPGMPQIQPAPTDPTTQAVQSRLPGLEEMAKTLRDQGLSGMALFEALQAHQQFLNMDGKRELAQISGQVRMLLAENAGRRADIAQEIADTGRQNAGTRASDAARREATAEGTNALGAATIEEKQAHAQHLRQMGAQASQGKPGKPQVFTDADGKMYSSVLLPSGEIVVRDAKGRQLAEEDVPQKVTPGQATMIHTVQLDERELDMSLDLMRKAGPEATASAFFDTSKDKGALTRWVENTLTPEDYQTYDVAANRIATAVAGIQSMGRGQVSDEKIRQARKLVPAPGDKPGTIKLKLDYLQGIREWSDDIIKGKKKLVTPSAADRAWVKAHPEDTLAFIKQFGETP